MVKRFLNILLPTRILKKIRPLCLFFPKMSGYRRDFDETKYISFLIQDDELLEKYNEICEKLEKASKKNLIVQLYVFRTGQN